MYYNYFICLSIDNNIKLWRVYAYTKECLVLMMSFDVAGVPSHVSVLYDRICVCVNDTDRASYTNTIYSLTDKCKCDGHYDTKEHTLV